jgi:hypothetical protein
MASEAFLYRRLTSESYWILASDLSANAHPKKPLLNSKKSAILAEKTCTFFT